MMRLLAPILLVCATTGFALEQGVGQGIDGRALAPVNAPPPEYDGRLLQYGFVLDSGIDPNTETEKGITVARVVLTDSGRLRITLLQYAPGDYFGFVSPVRERVSGILPTPVYDALLQSVRLLANAEIHEQYAEVICMVEPTIGMRSNDLRIARDYDASTQSFAQGLSLVQTGGGCWRHLHVYPVDDWASLKGQQLRAQIEILVIYFVARAQGIP